MGRGLGRHSLTLKTDHQKHVHYTQENIVCMNIDTICAYMSLQCTVGTEFQTQMALGPESRMGGFSTSPVQTRISESFPARCVPGFQSFPKPLAFCLSACLSHVGAALREGEDFSVGIVGREGVLAGLFPDTAISTGIVPSTEQEAGSCLLVSVSCA